MSKPSSKPLKTRAKELLLASIDAATGRHSALLPREARDEDAVLEVEAPYRVETPTLELRVTGRARGTLAATLMGYDGYYLTKTLWRSEPRECETPCEMMHDLRTGEVSLAGRPWGRIEAPLPARRFVWKLVLSLPGGTARERTTGHYRPAGMAEIGESYFEGEHYIDHEAQSVGDHPKFLKLLKEFGAQGPALEIGCATGGFVGAMIDAGIDAVGLDISEWAIQQATKRLGPGRAWACDVERDPFPAGVAERAPFGTLALSSVFEHFREPYDVLEKIGALARRGTILLLSTTNADSLTHWLFGGEWEGRFDDTHHGVEKVGVRRLREELPRLGWRVRSMTTHMIWDGNADPTRATLRDWSAADARFRRLLAERGVGDMITCVAERE